MKKSSVLVVMLALGLLLSACGANTDNNSSKPKKAVTKEANSSAAESKEAPPTSEPSKEEKQSESTLEEVNDGTIAFRNIPWYSTKADVEKKLFSEGSKSHGFLGSPEEIYRISGTDYSNVTMGGDRVDGGGYRGWYADISVAGYAVEDTYACYMYPVYEDGTLNQSENEAQLYIGWYTFKKDKYEGMKALYDDLNSKISSLYGDGEESKTDNFTTITWKDEKQNQVRLLINKDDTYATLGYMAADADARLDQVQEAVNQSKAAEEDSNREENKDNTSGL